MQQVLLSFFLSLALQVYFKSYKVREFLALKLTALTLVLLDHFISLLTLDLLVCQTLFWQSASVGVLASLFLISLQFSWAKALKFSGTCFALELRCGLQFLHRNYLASHRHCAGDAKDPVSSFLI